MKTRKNSSNNNSGFPDVRLRRLRKTPAIRDLFQETHLSVKDLIAPIFVEEGLKKPQDIGSMPDIKRLPLSSLSKEVEELSDLGVRAIILFGLPAEKDDKGSQAFADKGIVQKSVEQVRKHFGDKIAVITDVCLCQYTSHGHCGIVIDGGKIDNDSSASTLGRVAVSQARAGADIVAPSAMMDGQVRAIRSALDDAGFSDTAIMSYSSKQASPLFAPFRDAAHSAPEFGDRKTYQMPFTNPRESMREIEQDISEGVDAIIIKPAIPNLDLIYQASEATSLPICAYSVSGEYALIKAAAMEGWIDENAVMTEFLTGIKRAGADMIITYQAKKMAKLLSE
ncbi:porphobilinogen synthase [Candidatus Nitrososphaera evergladensis SR1]|uniref:Delta-aminolevulinic acid dehydratase n=1 Tax=Candidatus Nitrososphaera evergladensis SR1 TaxID=1459636 RepID=A0A075MQF8_9ARCH|nr:porphobilinogen synthase [Candidatus Nitrososphaera evergladensis]AIF83448.1 porphobilinogen synthase [Candidatus Nitrososphaera evergladensis SR1]